MVMDWHSFLADDMTFTSFTSPPKRLRGRAAYLESTRRFFAMITSITLKELIVDGERACALTGVRAPRALRCRCHPAQCSSWQVVQSLRALVAV